MPQLLRNNVTGVLSAGIGPTAVNMTLVDASSFPAPGSDYYLATLVGLNGNGLESSWEIVRVTAKASNTLTIVRGQESTVAQSWPSATTVQMRLTAASVPTKDEFTTHASSTSNPHSVTKAQVGLSNVENTALSTWSGSGNLTTVGTVASGVWQASAVGIAYGGTGATTKTAGFNALSPVTTLGDLIFGDGANSNARLAGNTTANRRFLRQTGTGTVSAAPAWDALVDGDIPSALTGKTYNALTLGANAVGFSISGGVTSKTFTVNNSIALNGTDGTTITLPATTGTVALSNQTFFLGTTSVAINRASAAISLAGVSIDGSAGSATTATTSTHLASGVLGSLPYQSAAATTALLAPNTTTTRNFLRMTGTGAAGAAPAWDTVTKTDVGLSNVENTALSTWAGSASITTLGTIATGTWNGTAISIARGGTGQATAVAAFDALAPTTTLGDLIYHDGADNVRLAGSTANGRRFLRQTGTGTVSAAPAWDALTDGDIPSTLTGKTYNGLTLTAAATGFTAAGGTTSKTLTVSNTLTLAGSDGATLNIGAGGTLGTGAYANIASYAPLGAANIFTANQTISNSGPVLSLRDSDSTGAAQVGYVSYQNSGGTETAWVGFGSGTSTDFNINNSVGAVTIQGFVALHASNYGSYAPSLTGAGASGTWSINVTGSAAALGGYTADLQTTTASGDYLLVRNQSSTKLQLATAASAASIVRGAASGTWGISVTGNAATATALTSTLAIAGGGTGATSKTAAFDALAPTTTLGDTMFFDGTDVVRLAGNTTTSKRFLTQTGTGTVSAAPGWNAIVDGDIPSALTGKTYNGLNLTANATGFQVSGGTTAKTLAVSNNLTLAGTDGSTLNIGGGGTLGTGAYATIANYAPLASPTFTGTPAAPTAAVDTNTTQLATTAYVVGQGYLKSATASSTYLPLGGGTIGGNLTFSGSGRTIRGDFSNSTSSSRTAFQSSTTNGQTIVTAKPNGTSTASYFITHNAEDVDNSSHMYLGVTSTQAQLRSDKTGTGSLLPLGIYVGGSEKLRIENNGLVDVRGSTQDNGSLIAPINSNTIDFTNTTITGAIETGDRLFGTDIDLNTIVTDIQYADLENGPFTSTIYISNSQTVPETTIRATKGGANVFRFTDTDTAVQPNQPIGVIEWYGNDSSAPGPGVKAYIGSVYESTSPDTSLIFGTSDNVTGSLAVERVRITSSGDLVVGNGSASNAPTNGTIRTTDGRGTDIGGATLIIEGGRGTGTGSGGPIVFSTAAPSGTSGSSTNAISERARIDYSGNVQLRAGALVSYAPTPAAIAAAATLTNANIQTQIINTTGTSYTVTMPLGTTLETLVPWGTTNIGYDFYVINTATGTITIAANTGVTTLGGLTIATGTSAQFRIRRTAANTFVLYRLR